MHLEISMCPAYTYLKPGCYYFEFCIIKPVDEIALRIKH